MEDKHLFKLLIVEDEHIVRLALKSLIDWRSNGIELIAEAVNGSEAIKVLSNEPVDLVITDINMPVMNGIELIKMIHQLGLDTSVIVLSAYNDYDYVREAFKLGVKDYILKAEMDPVAILEMVKKTLATRVANSYAMTGLQNNQKQRKDFYLLLKSIAEGVDPTDKATVDSTYHELGFKGEFDSCVLLIDDFARIMERYGAQELGSFSKHVIEYINFQLKKEQFAKVVCMQASTYLILHCSMSVSEAVSRNKLDLVLSSIQKSLKVYLDITVSIGVVNHCQSLTKLNAYYREALTLANLRYLYGKSSIIYQKNANFIKQIDSERILGQEKALIDAIKGMDPNKVDTELDILLNRIASFKSKNLEQLTCYYLELVLLININCREMNPYLFGHNTDLYAIINQFETKEEIHLWIRTFVRKILEQVSKENQQVESNQIKKAKKFIVNHYMENIGLSDVAEVVELSESYLSKLFMTETGETFIHFLTRYRINIACDLLGNSNLKIYEVAKNIGYDNVEHFSRVFKKTMGLSPIEYKKHH